MPSGYLRASNQVRSNQLAYCDTYEVTFCCAAIGAAIATISIGMNCAYQLDTSISLTVMMFTGSTIRQNFDRVCYFIHLIFLSLQLTHFFLKTFFLFFNRQRKDRNIYSLKINSSPSILIIFNDD